MKLWTLTITRLFEDDLMGGATTKAFATEEEARKEFAAAIASEMATIDSRDDADDFCVDFDENDEKSISTCNSWEGYLDGCASEFDTIIRIEEHEI